MRLWAQLDSLIRELKRREVLRAAAVYAVSAWVAVQVATDVFPSLQFPTWMTTLVVVASLLGFPVVIVAAWVYEVTPQGIRRTPEAEGPPELVRARGTPWVAMLLVGVVTAASVGIGWAAWDLWLEPNEETVEVATPVQTEPNFPRTRVAVLPLEDDSPDGSLDYVAEGLTKGLIDALSEVSALDVVPYLGVRQYRDTALPLDSIARQRNAGSLVAGRIDVSGNSLEARIELLDARTGSTAGSTSFRVNRDSVLALEDQIVFEAVRQLRRPLGERIQRAERRAGASSDEAWELFHRASLRADEGTDLRLDGQVDLAARMYTEADSLYARAERLDRDWSGPTLQRGWLALERAALTGEEITAKAPGSLRTGIGYAERALDDAPDDVAALELRGALRSALSWVSDSAGELRAAAIEDLERAVAQDPDRARAWADLSDLYRRAGRYVDAQKASERAWEADAYLANEPEYLRQSAHVALEVGQFEEALERVATGRERIPEALWPDGIELLVMATAGAPAFDPDSAWTVLSRMERLQGEETPMGRMQVAAVLARAGLGDSARAVLDRALGNVSDRARVFAMPYRANVHLHLGEESRTLELLERYLEAVPSEREYVSRDVWWEPLRGDSAFQALVSAEN